MARNTSSGSEDNEADLIAAFQKGAQRGPQKSVSPSNFVSDEASANEESIWQRRRQTSQKLVAVRASPVRDRNEYIYYDGKDTVHRVRREITKRGNTFYHVEFVDGTDGQVSQI